MAAPRIFDITKADEFCLGFLGFGADGDHRFDKAAPLYRRISRGGLVLHLSEHHGDGSPGAKLRVMMTGVEATAWGTLETSVADPFGNVIRFCETRDEGA